jgi:Flp pilus assembly protein TadD
MNADAPSLQPWRQTCRWATVAVIFVAVLFVAWTCVRDPDVHFLTPGPGEWIVYPVPPDLLTFQDTELTGTFRGVFFLPEKPATALLSWRCLTNGQVLVNGAAVSASDSTSQNWKTVSQTDISRWLHSGTNEISVVVINRAGPPALSLELQTGDSTLASDESWQVSVSDSDWRSALPASAIPPPGKGNLLSEYETTGDAFGRCWPRLFVFVAISSAAVMIWHFYLRGKSPLLFVLPLAAAWVLLFAHNFPLLPAACGFDGAQHLQYVGYVQEHHRLPAARQGWEMFQPPLYYLVSAKILDVLNSQTFDPAGMLALRWFGLAIGIATLALVFFGLRLVFPGDWKKPLAGLIFAAFLPAQVCLLNYVTNETLSALFVTAALCVTLHLLRTREPHWGWLVALGVALGLALSSKSSPVLALPVIGGILAIQLALRRERRAQVWLLHLALPLAACLLVGGWHYFKLWQAYGNPLIGNWDPKVADPWWQAKGYHTVSDYFSFGHALTHPFFSGLHSFWDGIYSTLWGDGLLGGRINLWGRAPWNYDLMTAGFVLALVPSALVLTGLVRAVANWFRAPDLPWLLLLTLGSLFNLGILVMSLKIPSYAQLKAFYGLPALLPLCALAALGFEFWADRGKLARGVLAVAIGVWLLNVYASFWIRPGTVLADLSCAIAANAYEKGDPCQRLAGVLDRHPGDAEVSIWLASVEAQQHPDLAAKRLQQVLEKDPGNAWAETYLARDLARCGRTDEALSHARHAVELAPEDQVVARTWCSLESHGQTNDEAVVAARHALDLNPTDVPTHLLLENALRANK